MFGNGSPSQLLHVKLSSGDLEAGNTALKALFGEAWVRGRALSARPSGSQVFEGQWTDKSSGYFEGTLLNRSPILNIFLHRSGILSLAICREVLKPFFKSVVTFKRKR